MLISSLWIAFLALSGAAAALPPALEGTDLRAGKPSKIEFATAPRATIVAFLSAACPCSSSHEPTLNALRSKYEAQGFRFVAIHSNQDESMASAAEHFRNSPLAAPVIEDVGAKFADAFGALKTPHIFVLDPRGEILYRGGVDDSHQAANAKKHYLADALAAIAVGRRPETPQTRTLGCVITRK